MYIDLGMFCGTLDIRMNVLGFLIYLNSLYVIVSSKGLRFENTETQNSDESNDLCRQGSCLELARLPPHGYHGSPLQSGTCLCCISGAVTLSTQQPFYLLNKGLVRNVSRPMKSKQVHFSNALKASASSL